ASEDAAHAIDRHGQASLFAPAYEQVAHLAVAVGQALPIVAALEPGADLRHLHMCVPQPGRVDVEVGGHPIDSLTASAECGTRLADAPAALAQGLDRDREAGADIGGEAVAGSLDHRHAGVVEQI